MGKLIEWSLDQISDFPSIPVPFILGLFVIFMVVFPTIRKAWRAQVEEIPKPVDALPIVQLNASAVYTVLTNIQLSIEELKLDVTELHTKVDILKLMLRRRQRGKTSKGEDIEG